SDRELLQSDRGLLQSDRELLQLDRELSRAFVRNTAHNAPRSPCSTRLRGTNPWYDMMKVGHGERLIILLPTEAGSPIFTTILTRDESSGAERERLGECFWARINAFTPRGRVNAGQPGRCGS